MKLPALYTAWLASAALGTLAICYAIEWAIGN